MTFAASLLPSSAVSNPLVPILVIGFAVFDLLEVVHQVDVARPDLAAIAAKISTAGQAGPLLT